MILSLFDYTRETRHQTAHGGVYVEKIDIDGASLVSIGLGIAIIFSLRGFNREIKRLCTRIGLPAKLPSVAYEWLPLALAPFLIIAFSHTNTTTTESGSVGVTSGFGNSSTKFVMLILLCVLIYVGKQRGRLKEMDERFRAPDRVRRASC